MSGCDCSRIGCTAGWRTSAQPWWASWFAKLFLAVLLVAYAHLWIPLWFMQGRPPLRVFFRQAEA